MNRIVRFHNIIQTRRLPFWNVGHQFKLTFCMHLTQFKTIHQVLDFLLVLMPASKLMQSRLGSPGWRSYIFI